MRKNSDSFSVCSVYRIKQVKLPDIINFNND